MIILEAATFFYYFWGAESKNHSLKVCRLVKKNFFEPLSGRYFWICYFDYFFDFIYLYKSRVTGWSQTQFGFSW